MTCQINRQGSLLRTLLISGLLCVCCSFELQAEQEKGKKDGALDFVVGNLEFILLHELAHVVIGEKRIPILGSEESAADYFATTTLLRGQLSNPDSSEALKEFTLSAAAAFATAWQLSNNKKHEILYWDNHQLSIQRYYSILCLMYGSNTDNEHLPEMNALPEQRAQNCEYEFQNANTAVQWVIDTYGRKTEDPKGVEATIKFAEGKNSRERKTIEELRRLNIVESTASAFTNQFAFNNPFEIAIRHCWQPEAAWQPDKRELVICLELVDALYDIYYKNKKR